MFFVGRRTVNSKLYKRELKRGYRVIQKISD